MTENHYKTKMVIVMRTDLNMRKGKMVAQGAHAAMAFLTRRICGDGFTLEPVEWEWLENSFAKVCVGVGSANELYEIIGAAGAAGVTAHEITDNGTTEFGGVPTLTCCALGPDRVEILDAITGKLKLL